jgi:hypothetical protein
MYKVLIISTIAFMLNSSIFAQDYVINLQSVKSSASLERNDLSGVQMNFSVNSIYGKSVASKDGDSFIELYFGKGYAKGEIGTPKLPAFKKLIQIPHGAEVELKVLGYSQTVLNLKDYGIENLLYPNQPSPSKSDELESLPFHYNKNAYLKAGFSDEPIAKIEILGTLRGARIARVEVYPVDYDPVNNEILVYNDISVEVNYSGVDKEKNERILKSTYSPFFEPVYKALSNPFSKGVYDEHPDLVKYPVKMVIVSHRMFEQTLQPYILWKTQKGFNVEVAYTDVIGYTSQEIKNYLYANYNSATESNPAPSFLVIVGDVQQVAASAVGSSSKKMTDLYYASVDGDYFPEMYYGRLSAQTTTQLENIINKIIYYEKYQFEDPRYLDNVTLIAGVDSYWNPNVGQPTAKYGTKYNFNTNNGYNTVWGYGIANDPNNPNNSSGYTGCYDKPRIEVALINYTAHCNENRWAEPFLGISTINSLTNTNKYPLAIGNCCLSADFGFGESLGEAWIRAENKGAVTYIGSSPNSFWFEDFYWSVGAFPITGDNSGYVPTFEETTLGAYDATLHSNYLTTGGLVFIGNLAVTEVDIKGYRSHSSPLYYWQAYNILGDPSLMPFFTQGDENFVSHLSIFPLGQSSLTVSALADSYVAISMNGMLLGTALVDASGEVTIGFEEVTQAGEIDIVVTRPQTKPYINKIPTVVLEGPFISLESFTVNDEAGNNNNTPDYGETFNLNIALKNIGVDEGTNITAVLTGEDQYFTVITNTPVDFGTINIEATTIVNNAFTIELANDVPNGYLASFELQITDGEKSWNSNLVLRAIAPSILIGELEVDDNNDLGIPNVLDPGETANIVIKISNNGESATTVGLATLSTTNEYVTINGDNTVNIPVIQPDNTIDVIFSVTVNEQTPMETEGDFNLLVVAGSYSAQKDFSTTIGEIPEYKMGTVSVVESCMGRFYDSGGSNANYSNNENSTITFFPKNSGSAVKFEFVEFSTENNYDLLYIYNGSDITAPQFPGSPFSGTKKPGVISASNIQGAITFQFKSDISLNAPGWYANFECFEITGPPECAQVISPQHLSEAEYNPLLLSWKPVSGAFDYDVYIGAGELPSEPTFTTNHNFVNYVIDDFEDYVWKVVPLNNFGEAEECPIWNFYTTQVIYEIFMHSGSVEVCNGLFYDSGGSQNNYSNFEDYTLTILPTESEKKIRLSFYQFNLENNWDFFSVYNGLEVTPEKLMAKLTGNTLPTDFIATNEHGALTVRFTSDYSNTFQGWVAQVSCETATNVAVSESKLNIYPNPFNDYFTIRGISNTVRIDITNTLGSVVYSALHNATDEITIPTHHLAKGVYIITISSNKGERDQRKLIKQ